MPYPPLDPKQSVDALERQLLATWKHERLFEKQREATRYGPPFVFYEGPPTANGRPGLHHVFSRTIKDLVCRYQTMLGHGVTRIAGWDTHGLPVEIEVEKQLRINGKKDIEAYGVERFNQLCRESVFTYKTDWEALSDRIGYWLDYEHPYITYDPKYIESVWWLLKKLHDKSLLYRGHKVLPYCPRCGTALSSHELALGYDTVQTNSVFVTFPLATTPRGSSSCGPRRRGRCSPTWRWRCTPTWSTASTSSRACATSRPPPAPPTSRCTGRRSPRGRGWQGTPGAISSANATCARSRSCRSPRRASAR